MVSNATFRSGELARVTGVSADTLRHYERIGVLPRAPRTSSGYRVYPADAVNRVRVVRRALHIGFTLPELADIFRTREAGGAPCQRVFELAKTKLAAIEADIATLTKARRQMVKVLSDWQSRMRKTSRGQKAHLLQSLPGKIRDTRRSTFRRKR